MTDDDFAAIKAAFPALEWRRSWAAPDLVAVARGVSVRTYGGGYWTAAWRGTDLAPTSTLPDCLTALRAAIVAERDALNSLLGEA